MVIDIKLKFEIKDSIVKSLSEDELDELISGTVLYYIHGTTPTFSSEKLNITFLFLQDNIERDKELEQQKKSRSEIYRQNVMKRWEKAKNEGV